VSENGQRHVDRCLRFQCMDALQTTGRSTSSLRTRIYHGWLVVGAAFLIAFFGFGIGFYGPGIYLVALQERHGWSAAGISFAITVYYLLGASQVFFAGVIFESLGARSVVIIGAVAMACGIVLLTVITHSWQVYMAFAVMSLGWAAMSGAAVNIIIAPWFERRRGLAVSLALNGASAGGIVIPVLLIMLIRQLGFGTTLCCAAGAMLAAVVPTAAFFLRRKRPDERDRADGESIAPTCKSFGRGPTGDEAHWSLNAVLRSRSFQTISIPFALGMMAQVGFLTHQFSYLSPILGTTAAGWLVSLTTFSAVAGRVAMGSFVDKIDRRTAACGNFFIQIAGMGLLVSNASVTTLYLGCVLFGLGVGNMISVPGLIVQQEFPRQHFSRIVSLVVGINQLTFAFGPGLLGYLRRVQGSYTISLLVCLVLEITAAIIVVLPLLGWIAGRKRGK
jgi:MFS family permease